MAYSLAFLNINNEFETYETPGVPVWYCAFEFNRKIDVKTGHFQGNVHSGLIQVVVEVDKKTALLLNLMLKSERFDGKLIFKMDTATGGATKTLEFTQAVFVDYRETFDTSLNVGMRLNLSIWSENIDVEGELYTVNWKKEVDH